MDSRRDIGQNEIVFWMNVGQHYTRHKLEGGAYQPSRSLETKWVDIKVDVDKIIGCYWTITELDEYGKTKDDILQNALNLDNQRCEKLFVFKHCWVLLKSYPCFATTFYGKENGGKAKSS